MHCMDVPMDYHNVKYYTATLSKTHGKTGQRNAEMKGRFVDDTE